MPKLPITARTRIDAPGSWEHEFDGLDTAQHPDVAVPEALESDGADPTADLVGRRMEAFRRRYDGEAPTPDRPPLGTGAPSAPPARPAPASSSAAAPKISKTASKPTLSAGGLALVEKLKGLRVPSQTASKLMRLTWVAFLGALFLVILLQLRTPAFNLVNSGVENARQRAAFDNFGDFRAMGGGSGKPISQFELLDESLMNRVDYRLDFAVLAPKGGFGWAVRAADGENYYAFRLERVGKKLQFRRYPVIDGVPQKEEEIIAPLTDLDLDEGVRISSRVSGQQISTFVNGNGVDYFREERLAAGGVAFFTEGRDQASVSYYSVRGNQDNWGLTLFGAIGIWDDTVKFFSAEVVDEDFSPPQLSQVSE